MERPDWALAVVDEVGKVGRAIAVADTVHDAEVDLERLLDSEEDAPDLLGSRERFDRAIRDQIDVEFRPEVLDESREAGAERLAGLRHARIELRVPAEVVLQ